MELDNLDQVDPHFVSRANVSPFFMSSRAPTASPQSWELHDVDFLLTEPVAGSRSYFQDSSRKFCSSLHESVLDYSPELEDTTRPLAFRSGVYWQDVALSEPATSEFSTYLADDVFSDKVATMSNPPSTKASRGKLAQPAQLRVNTTACTDGALAQCLNARGKTHTLLKDDTCVVSPTTVGRKVLVSENDLKLFSAGNMKVLSGRKVAVNTSPRLKHHSKTAKAVMAAPSSFQAPVRRQQIKRCASLKGNIDEHSIRALKRTKSLDQSAWCAPAFDPRWYCGKLEGFHGMQPRLLSPIHGTNVYRPVQHQVSVQQPQQSLKQQLQPQYQPSKRKIGIYSPAERRERLKRFHEKRKHRVYHKRIKYDCRKRLANSCPRIKGRFVRKSQVLQAKESDTASSTTSDSA